jgi:DNA-binding response OmpR family regulator
MQPKKQRILSVEDDEQIRVVISELLEQAGYEVKLSGTFADGLRLAAGEPFKLIILNYMLPDGTGLELCHEIRQFDPHIPIIFFASDNNELDIQRERSNFAQDYLTKPAGISDLVATVDRLLNVG